MRKPPVSAFSAGIVLCCLLFSHVPAASAARAVTLQTLSQTRRLQRLAQRKVAKPPSAVSSAIGASTRLTVRPTIRTIRRQALRNAADDREPPRPTRGFEQDEQDEIPPAPVFIPPTGVPDSEIDTVKLELLRLVNEVRAKHGLSALSYNKILERAAQRYAEDMQNRNFFSHESPEGSTFDERIKQEGYPGPCPKPGCGMQLYLGENLAKGFTSPQAVLDGWMESPGHRANILNENFKEVGLGIAGTLWTQEFGQVVYTY